MTEVALKITGPGDALAIWRKADAENDMETMSVVEEVVFLMLDPADIPRMKIVPEGGGEDFREKGFETKADYLAEIERAARTCLMVIWSNGKVRAGATETAQ